jgi:hypothetical protein
MMFFCVFTALEALGPKQRQHSCTVNRKQVLQLAVLCVPWQVYLVNARKYEPSRTNPHRRSATLWVGNLLLMCSAPRCCC